jgi:hypothetical protein
LKLKKRLLIIKRPPIKKEGIMKKSLLIYTIEMALAIVN